MPAIAFDPLRFDPGFFGSVAEGAGGGAFDPALFDPGLFGTGGRDSSAIDAALVARLLADGPLRAMLPDGVFFDEAPGGSTRFVIVSLADEVDVAHFGGCAYEDALYMVKAVGLSTSYAASSGTVQAAAARIHKLLEDEPLEAAGYSWMTTHRTGRIRTTEVDGQDSTIRWHHRGGLYRLQFAPL